MGDPHYEEILAKVNNVLSYIVANAPQSLRVELAIGIALVGVLGCKDEGRALRSRRVLAGLVEDAEDVSAVISHTRCLLLEAGMTNKQLIRMCQKAESYKDEEEDDDAND